MRSAAFVHAIILSACITLSLNAEEIAGEKLDIRVEKTEAADKNAGAHPYSIDIRDRPVPDLKEKKPEKNDLRNTEKRPSKKKNKKPLKKTVSKRKTGENKTGKNAKGIQEKSALQEGSVSDLSIGEFIEGAYTVKQYGRITSDTGRASGDTTAPYRYIFRRDGTGTVDMNDPAVPDMKFRWHIEGNALILEELDIRGFVTKRLRFMFLKKAANIVFEKSDVQYGDPSAKRWQIIKSGTE